MRNSVFLEHVEWKNLVLASFFFSNTGFFFKIALPFPTGCMLNDWLLIAFDRKCSHLFLLLITYFLFGRHSGESDQCGTQVPLQIIVKVDSTARAEYGVQQISFSQCCA